ncbi:MAG TPA: hypothetical protein DGF10_02080 [Acidimicrobiaceae bacterium]|nr:hypothetical protein [Acidimicrobiaceae bacterium]HAQ23949.1 hypothetical protein [Acidimicrobiaceae bacterium]HCV33430.1 hypothetical protein [Acidimicrobiaceae bacterium]|tara:strand:- start:799 stop:1470 length:672 start_codon:yes stop_codon:yes gene_type:complete
MTDYLEPQQRKGPGRTIALVLAGAVALALVAALTLSGDEEKGDPDGLETGPVAIYGDALPGFTDSAGDPALGSVAPSFDATTFAGATVQIRPGDGIGYVIGFFAHWCPHCQAEVPKLVEWIARGGIPDGVKIIAVSTGVRLDRGNPPKAWFDSESWPEAVVRDDDDSSLGQAYGLRSFPYFVVVGADGRIRGRLGGGLIPQQWDWLLDQAGRSGIVASGASTA